MHSLRTIVRAALTRFLPGYALGILALYILGNIADRLTLRWSFVAVAGLILTLGYMLALLPLRSRLLPGVGVEGRRSVIAGMLSPVVALMALLYSGPESALVALSVLVPAGALITLGIFFPWITTRWRALEAERVASELAASDWRTDAALTPLRERDRP